MGEVLTQYESSSKPGTYHKIVKGRDGIIYCDCWAWKRNRKCKHLDRYFSKGPVQITPVNIPSPSRIRQIFEELERSGWQCIAERLKS